MSKPQHVAPWSERVGPVSWWRSSSWKPVKACPILVALAASGCAGVPFDAPKEPSAAAPPARASQAGRAAGLWLDDRSGKSGFVPLGNGETALGARLRNLEMRIFNPVSRSGPRSLAFLQDFSRTNRLMHSKSFVKDGPIVIVGGRNSTVPSNRRSSSRISTWSARGPSLWTSREASTSSGTAVSRYCLTR